MMEVKRKRWKEGETCRSKLTRSGLSSDIVWVSREISDQVVGKLQSDEFWQVKEGTRYTG